MKTVAFYVSTSLVLLFVVLSIWENGLFKLHPSLMGLGYLGCMFQAIYIFSTDDTSRSRLLTRKKQILIHSLLQVGTISCSITAFTAIYVNKQQRNKPHFTSWHGLIGLIVFIWSLLQAMAGLLLTILQQYIHSLRLTYAQLRIYHATSGVLLFTLSCFVLILGLASNWFKTKMPTNTIIYSIFEMKSTKLLLHVRRLSSLSNRQLLYGNSFQQRCLLHTCLPLMNKEKSSNEKNSSKSDEFDEQPHMRIEAKATAEEKNPTNYMMYHEIYSEKELNAIKVTHKKFESWHDRVAYAAVRTLRFFFDTFTGYVHQHPKSTSDNEKENRRARKTMDEAQWLRRIIFLESIAGVPGMVAGMSRHMKSLRTMQRDHGWIHVLLSEAENERMHLLTFLELRNPGWIFRGFVLLGQGVFFNAFFISYLISPKICHRFVGFLEEEAVVTYTRCLEELDAGRLPIWAKTAAPQIAKNYWKLKDDALMKDVLLAVRADEATHRQVNHKLADVGPNSPNPFLDRKKEERDPPDEKEQKEIDTAGKK